MTAQYNHFYNDASASGFMIDGPSRFTLVHRGTRIFTIDESGKFELCQKVEPTEAARLFVEAVNNLLFQKPEVPERSDQELFTKSWRDKKYDGPNFFVGDRIIFLGNYPLDDRAGKYGYVHETFGVNADDNSPYCSIQIGRAHV